MECAWRLKLKRTGPGGRVLENRNRRYQANGLFDSDSIQKRDRDCK